ncbi:MAG TPA: hypothetical protein VF065_01440 [Ilumatobacter sp.]
MVLLGACGDPESPSPPAASARAVPATTSAANLAPRPDDGCSPDNSPTEVVAAPGPVPEVAVRSESAASPLPDLAVRRINCAGGWVNLRNELPADRPVLVWFWAPY